MFREPFGAWTSAPKIAVVRTKKKSFFSCGPGGGERLFEPLSIRAKGVDVREKLWPKTSKFMLCFRPESMSGSKESLAFGKRCLCPRRHFRSVRRFQGV